MKEVKREFYCLSESLTCFVILTKQSDQEFHYPHWYYILSFDITYTCNHGHFVCDVGKIPFNNNSTIDDWIYVYIYII